MSHAPVPHPASGLVVCIGLPSDQIIEIARLLRGRAVVLATPDAESARAALAGQVEPPRQDTEPRSRGRGAPTERYDNPGPTTEPAVGRQSEPVPIRPHGTLVELPRLRPLLSAQAAPTSARSERSAADRAAAPPPSREPLLAGPLRVDLAGREVVARGRRIYLSAREFDLLATLALEAGRVWSFGELTARVWRLPYLGDSDPVTSAVKRLRKRLAPVRDVEIASVRGVGYRLKVST